MEHTNSELFTRSFENLVSLFLGDTTVRERRRERRLMEYLEPLVHAILNTPALVALRDLRQQGFAPIPFHRSVDRAPIPYSKVPREHNRWHHSRYVAAVSAAMAIRLKLSWQETRTLVIAALCHDVGHVAFGHKMDYALKGIAPNWHHETRTAEIIETDPFVRAVFATARIDTRTILRVIAEHGRLGAIQRISDTAGYCFVDSLATGFFGSCDHESVLRIIRAYIASVRDVTDDGVVVFYDSKPVRDILSLRAQLFADNYYALEAWRCEVALRVLLRTLHAYNPEFAFERSALEADWRARTVMAQAINASASGDERDRLNSMLNFPECNGMTGWRLHTFESADELAVWRADQSPDTRDRAIAFERMATAHTVKRVDAVVDGAHVRLGPHERDIVAPNAPPAVAYEWTGLTH